VKEQSTPANYTLPLEQVRKLLAKRDEQGRPLFQELHLEGGEFHDVDGVPWVAPGVTLVCPVMPPTGAGTAGDQQQWSGSV
jgi:hypothetical protein